MDEPRPPAVSQSLADMLGLPADASVSRLRFGYEAAMADALRRGDQQRAVRLSKAFDALSTSQRRGIYANADRSGPSTMTPIARSAGRTAVRPGRVRRSRRATAGTRRRPGRRVGRLAYAIVVPLAVVGGVALMIHFHLGPAGRAPENPPVVRYPHPSRFPTEQLSAPYVPPASTLHPSRVSRRVAVNTPADRRGLVTVICQPRAGGAGYVLSARPGSVVTCTNGAVPQIVG